MSSKKVYQARPLNLSEFDPEKLSYTRGIPLDIPSHNLNHSKLKEAFLIHNGVYYEAFKYVGFLPNMWKDSADVWRSVILTSQSLSYGRLGLMRKIAEKGEFSLMIIAADFKNIHSGNHPDFLSLKNATLRGNDETTEELIKVSTQCRSLHNSLMEKKRYSTAPYLYYYLIGEKELGYILKDMNEADWDLPHMCYKILSNMLLPKEEAADYGVLRLCKIVNGCVKTVVDSRLVCFRIAQMLKYLRYYIGLNCYTDDFVARPRTFAVDTGYQVTNEILTNIENSMKRWVPEIRQMLTPEEFHRYKAGLKNKMRSEDFVSRDVTTIVEDIEDEVSEYRPIEATSTLCPTSVEFVPQSYFSLAEKDSIVIKSKNTKVTIKAVGKEIPEELLIQNTTEKTSIVPEIPHVVTESQTQEFQPQEFLEVEREAFVEATEVVLEDPRIKLLEEKVQYWKAKAAEYLSLNTDLQMKLDEIESKL